MTRPLSADEMQYDISPDMRSDRPPADHESPFWSTCMGMEGSEFPVYVAGTSPTV